MKIVGNMQVIKKAYNLKLSQVAKKYDLTINQIIILIYLTQEKKGNTLTQIVKDLNMAKSYVSTTLLELEQKGYIEKKQSKEDKKKQIIKLNAKAKKVKKEAATKKDELVELMLEDIDENDKKIFIDVCNQMFSNLEKYINEENTKEKEKK